MRNQTSQYRIVARRAKTPQRVQRRGISIILVGVVLVALIGFVSLAVDIGRLRLANAELQTAADAAARAGAWSLPGLNGVANPSQDVINEAVSAALANPSISSASNGQRADSGVVLNTTQDIQFGFWNATAKTFTQINDNGGTTFDERRAANAVRVEALRLTARGNPVKLIFGPVIGVMSKDAGEQSIAYITGGPDNFAFVGITGISSNGNKAFINANGGSVATDGNLNLGNGDIIGNARPGIGHTYNPGPNSHVTGWVAPLDFVLANDPRWQPLTSYPSDASPLPANNVLTGNPDPTNPKKYYGTSVPTSFTLAGLYVRIYVTGSSITMNPTITYTNPANPNFNPKPPDIAAAARLEIYGVGSASKTLTPGNGNAQIYAHIFAPQADFAIGGGVDFWGWVVAKSISYKGNSTLTYDGAKSNITSPAYQIHLVK